MVIRRCELEVSRHERILRRSHAKGKDGLGIREMQQGHQGRPARRKPPIAASQRWFAFSELLAFAVRLRHDASS